MNLAQGEIKEVKNLQNIIDQLASGKLKVKSNGHTSKEITSNASKFTVDWEKMEVEIEIIKDSRTVQEEMAEGLSKQVKELRKKTQTRDEYAKKLYSMAEAQLNTVDYADLKQKIVIHLRMVGVQYNEEGNQEEFDKIEAVLERLKTDEMRIWANGMKAEKVNFNKNQLVIDRINNLLVVQSYFDSVDTKEMILSTMDDLMKQLDEEGQNEELEEMKELYQQI